MVLGRVVESVRNIHVGILFHCGLAFFLVGSSSVELETTILQLLKYQGSWAEPYLKLQHYSYPAV